MEFLFGRRCFAKETSALEDSAGGLDDGIYAFVEVLVGDIYFHVGVDARLGAVHVAVVHGTGREPQEPTVWQLRGEGHSRTATCAVAYDGDTGQTFYVHGKGVSSAVGVAVGEYADALLPSKSRKRLYFDSLRRGEV